MRWLSIPFIAFTLILSGCSLSEVVDLEPKVDGYGYIRVSLTADIDVQNDGSIPQQQGGPVACFSKGYLASVLYFPIDGGEVVEQDSKFVLEDVSCMNCTSTIASNSTIMPVELFASLDVQNTLSQYTGDEEITASDTLTVNLQNVGVKMIDIYYSCGEGRGESMSDYGSSYSQLTTPFVQDAWKLSIDFDDLDISEKTVTFPPTYQATITWNIIEEYVTEIE